MVNPRHHIDDYRDYPDIHGCSHPEDWVINPRCCKELWHIDFDDSAIFEDSTIFDDSDSCRRYFDDIDDNTGSLHTSEWIMGTVIIGGIVLFGGILYCLWRRGKVKNL